jgi:hypothetical protein
MIFDAIELRIPDYLNKRKKLWRMVYSTLFLLTGLQGHGLLLIPSTLKYIISCKIIMTHGSS